MIATTHIRGGLSLIRYKQTKYQRIKTAIKNGRKL